jgi:Tfp pilus assembly protein PilN
MRPVNLLPADHRRDRLEAFKTTSTPALVFALGTVVLVAMLVGGFLVESAKVSDKRRTLETLQANLSAASPPQTPSAHSREVLQDKDQRVTALNNALIGRVAWDRVFRDLSSVLPGDVWLSRLKATTPGTSAPGATASSGSTSATATAGEQGFLLEGYAYSQEGVARLLARLEVVPDVTNLQLTSTEKTEIANRPVIGFKIAADVRAPEGPA